MEHQEEKTTNHNAAARYNRQNFKTKLEHNEPLSYWGVYILCMVYEKHII